jgi:hypothetical protein
MSHEDWRELNEPIGKEKSLQRMQTVFQNARQNILYNMQEKQNRIPARGASFVLDNWYARNCNQKRQTLENFSLTRVSL